MALGENEYIDEFLYRWREPGSDLPSGWQITVRDRLTRATRTLSVAQAADEGITLPAVMKAINTDSAFEAYNANQALTAASQTNEAYREFCLATLGFDPKEAGRL